MDTSTPARGPLFLWDAAAVTGLTDGDAITELVDQSGRDAPPFRCNGTWRTPGVPEGEVRVEWE